MTRGRFITFEGGEGSGKSTQIRRLAKQLEDLGHSVVTSREPGGTPYAEKVRGMLLTGAIKDQGPDAEAILVSSARVDHIKSVIKPALDAGQWVLCDRFADSTLAYQGLLDGGDIAFIADLNETILSQCPPDLTIMIDLPVNDALERLSKRSKGASSDDRYDAQDASKHETLRKAYLAIAVDNPERVTVVDGSADENAVAEAIWAVVTGRFETDQKVKTNRGRRNGR
ncbi:MAG: dTMP kinase [Pseudomonadota bacterium]